MLKPAVLEPGPSAPRRADAVVCTVAAGVHAVNVACAVKLTQQGGRAGSRGHVVGALSRHDSRDGTDMESGCEEHGLVAPA